MATIRIGLTAGQAASCNAAMITHIREQIAMDVVVGGVKYDLAELLQERLGADQIELMIVNTTIAEGVTKP